MRKEYNSKKYRQRQTQGKEESEQHKAKDIHALQGEKVFPILLKNVPFGIGIATMDGTVLVCNEVMRRLTGHTEHKIQNFKLSSTYRNPEDRVRLMHHLKTYGIVRRFETQLKRNDGLIYDVSLTVILLNIDDSDYILKVVEDITDHKRMEEALIKTKEEAEVTSRALEEAQIVIKHLLSYKDQEVSDLKETIFSNVKELILPYLEKAQQCNSGKDRKAYLNLVEDNLRNIISPFIRNIDFHYYNLTPREIHVANLIKDGKATKEIAELLHLYIKAIEFHRHNIRIKLGLTNKKTNLQSFLLSLSQP